METLYTVIFTGEILAGFQLASVKENLMRLFSLSAAQAEAILAKPGMILKKGIDEETCRNYEEVLSQAGVKTETVGFDPNYDPSSAPPAELNLNLALPTSNADGNSTIPIEFNGTGGEYFRIWLVNLLLSIVTLGIYSAWAKVRRKRYFYGNTKLEGTAFEYLADPIKILKGRLLVAGFAVVFALVSEFFPIISIGISLLFIILIPWLAIRSMAFNAYNSSYRNIRFGFDATYGEAAKTFILWPLLAILTIGIMAPYAYFKQVRFLVSHGRFGSTRFEFTATPRAYYRLFGKFILVFIAGMLIMGVIYFVFKLAVFFAGMAFYLFLFAYFSVRSTNLRFQFTKLAVYGFKAELKVWDYLKIVFVNIVAIVFTLGLFIPWAVIRTTKYKLSSLKISTAGNLGDFVAGEEKQISALGDAMNDMLDFDFGI